jgi:hypothetical protein
MVLEEIDGADRRKSTYHDWRSGRPAVEEGFERKQYGKSARFCLHDNHPQSRVYIII